MGNNHTHNANIGKNRKIYPLYFYMGKLWRYLDMWSKDVIELSLEYHTLLNTIVKDKIHEKKSPENTKIIMRVKEIKAELKKRGYFR